MQQPKKPTPKSFLTMFVRILVLCALAWAIVYGVKYLFGML